MMPAAPRSESQTPERVSRFQQSIETQLLIEFLREAPEGATIPYEAVNEACGCDVRRRRNVYQTAFNHLLRVHGQTWGCENGVGLHRLTQAEAVALGSDGLQAIKRAVGRRERVQTLGVDYEQLTESEKLSYNTSRTVLAVLGHIMKPRSQRKISAAVKTTTKMLPVTETLKHFGAISSD